MKVRKKFVLEKDMCNQIIVEANKKGWTVYPEQGGWDLLLVKNDIQVGIQAKLRPTLKLFSQAIVPESEAGPQFRAIAVGNLTIRDRDDLIKVAKSCKLIFIDMSCHPDYWLSDAKRNTSFDYYRHSPSTLVWLPPFIPTHAAGVPSPRTVSPWMVAAVRLEALYRVKGWVSIEDSRRIVKEEVPNNKRSLPRSLLQTYFKSTNINAPDIKRGKKWVLKISPARKFPHVLSELIKVGMV